MFVLIHKPSAYKFVSEHTLPLGFALDGFCDSVPSVFFVLSNLLQGNFQKFLLRLTPLINFWFLIFRCFFGLSFSLSNHSRATVHIFSRSILMHFLLGLFSLLRYFRNGSVHFVRDPKNKMQQRIFKEIRANF